MPRHIIMDPSGHSTIEFDSSNTTDLAEAERRFKRLVAKGFAPAEFRGDGKHSVPDKSQQFFRSKLRGDDFYPCSKRWLMIALSYSIIILIGFICLIAARSTVEGKLGSPEAKHKGLQLLLEKSVSRTKPAI